MKLNKVYSKKGLSLLELMIAIGLMGIVALVGSSILGNVTKEGLYVENRNIIRQTTAVLEKVTNRVVSKVSPTQYDPFNVVNFDNKKIGTEWKEVGDLKQTQSAVSTQEQGNLKVIYNQIANSSQLIPNELAVRGLGGCSPSSCYSCETALASTNPALMNEGTVCAPLNSCLYYSSKNYLKTTFTEKVSLCVKPTAIASGPLKVLALQVDKFLGAQSSHDLVVTDLTVDSSLKISKAGYKSNAVYMSRCVAVEDLSKVNSFQTYASIDSLRRPFVNKLEAVATETQKNAQGQNVSVKIFKPTDIKCCTPPKSSDREWTDDCKAVAEGDSAKFLPTIFVYKGENSVSTWPAQSERFLIPGLALIMQLDSASPKTFKLTTVQIENTCKSGRKRSNWPCSADDNNPYIPKNGEFSAQVEVKVTPKSGTVASGIVGSGIINLGNSVKFGN